MSSCLDGGHSRGQAAEAQTRVSQIHIDSLETRAESTRSGTIPYASTSNGLGKAIKGRATRSSISIRSGRPKAPWSLIGALMSIKCIQQWAGQLSPSHLDEYYSSPHHFAAFHLCVVSRQRQRARRMAHRWLAHRRIAHRRMAHRQMAHRRTAHRQTAHRQTAHRQMAHRRMAHRWMAHRWMAHRRMAHRQMAGLQMVIKFIVSNLFMWQWSNKSSIQVY